MTNTTVPATFRSEAKSAIGLPHNLAVAIVVEVILGIGSRTSKNTRADGVGAESAVGHPAIKGRLENTEPYSGWQVLNSFFQDTQYPPAVLQGLGFSFGPSAHPVQHQSANALVIGRGHSIPLKQNPLHE